MRRVVVIDDRDAVAESLIGRLSESAAVETCVRATRRKKARGVGPDYARVLAESSVDTVVYSPPLNGRRDVPDLADAQAFFRECARAGVRHLVLLSSAAVYGASPQNPGLIPESRPTQRTRKETAAGRWLQLEALAAEMLGGDVQRAGITILRPAPVLVPGGEDYFSSLLGGRFAVTLPGHDPSVQLLDPEDLSGAVCRAVETGGEGVYNVAPGGVIPLRKALRIAGVKRVPVPRTLQRLLRAPLARVGVARHAEQLEFIRYSWTVSNTKAERELGFSPRRSSAEALREFRAASNGGDALERETRAAGESSVTSAGEFDDFGMDAEYIALLGRMFFRFLERRYWRIEVDGFERVPREGRAVLVGPHRGFMPWDGIMLIHMMASRAGRVPRFLMHPGLIRWPFCFNFMTKLGAVIACKENADYVLEREGLLGVFPEGVNGVFTLYRDAYRLGKFGRNDFVKIALRNRAPIIPFVNVGSAEIFPILKKFEWGWWKRYSDWPCLPLTPTPLPLPSKWHVQFLAPVRVDMYPPEAAEDSAVVRAISREVRARMEEAIEEILRRRPSIFYGSVFGQEAG
jgi:1-acyl-sn-glycerol-3-phosphate acyltransferase/nucleoside-diphosphate-sugar epimerase